MKGVEKWERPGKKLETWTKTRTDGDASLMPYAPERVIGNK
jgi:hypothetical protein